MKRDGLNQLIKRKTLLLLQLEDVRRSAAPGLAILANLVAGLEGAIAEAYLAMGDADKAVVNLISQASCLIDAGESKKAYEVFVKARQLTSSKKLAKWIASESAKIRIAPSKQHIEVIIAEDHPLVCAGLRELLKANESIKVVGEAKNAKETMHLVNESHPDLIILDLALRGAPALSTLQRIKSSSPLTKIILLDHEFVSAKKDEVLRLGASAYLDIQSAPTKLGATICELYSGESESQSAGLTQRETDVLRLIAQGASRKEIAREIGISVKMTDELRSRLLEKLTLRDVANLASYVKTVK